jgi:uncharacterized protein YndB with AHSA1/START domain
MTDRIEKTIYLRAPRARVWAALTDAGQFGAWFGVSLRGPFVAGMPVEGRLTIPGYDHLDWTFNVEAIVPQTQFSYRWHPHAVDATVDYATEATTLVEFALSDEAGGTRLRVTESGFDRLPLARRQEVFPLNSEGWEKMLAKIERHVLAADAAR